MTNASPFVDQAQPILAGEPAITDEQRADLWDTFHNSKDENELARELQPIPVPDDLKQQLFNAKKLNTPAQAPVDKAASAINRIGQIDPKVLELAEKYPKVTSALITAATKDSDKESNAAAPKNKKNAAQTPAPLAQPPRPDGLEHLPPIPEGHRRVLASDGGVHDIPEENIEHARAIDPRLHVLNP